MAGRSALSRDEIATLRTIGEVAEHLDLPQHVLRFWETRFKEIDPVKRAGGRRFYRPRDIDLVEAIRHLLYREGYTIKGVQRILKEQGVDSVIADVRRRQSGESAAPPPPTPVVEPALAVAPTFVRQATLDFSPPEPLETAPAPGQPELEPRAPAPDAAPPVELGAEAETPSNFPQAEPAPRANAPLVVTRRLDQEQAQLLRSVLLDIEECKRLLNLTRR